MLTQQVMALTDDELRHLFLPFLLGYAPDAAATAYRRVEQQRRIDARRLEEDQRY